MTDLTMRRWRERYQEHGYSGLWDHRKRSPSPQRVPVKQLEQVLQLYREQYFDFNVWHFHEKLGEQHGIQFSYTWVKTALQEAGLVTRRKKPDPHRKRRPRRPLPGMLLHIDGSELIVILDDATSEIYYAQLVETEDTFTVLAAPASGNAQFVEELKMAAEAGTDYSAVLCGRATWKEGIPVYAKQGAKALEDWLSTEGVKNIEAVNAAKITAKPWYLKAGIPQPALA